MKKILVFTGAGVSAESGIKTFRDYDGLWENFSIEDVATPEAWKKNPALVLKFYNDRRAQLKEVQPNKAHQLIADLEKFFEVTVVTQNVDDLHERAGSTKIIHLHGELNKVRSEKYDDEIYTWKDDLNLGDTGKSGTQLRPHIVWFREYLNPQLLEEARQAAVEADCCLVVGTSLQVYPANEIPNLTKPSCPLYVIDPNASSLKSYLSKNIFAIDTPATKGMEEVWERLVINSAF